MTSTRDVHRTATPPHAPTRARLDRDAHTAREETPDASSFARISRVVGTVGGTVGVDVDDNVRQVVRQAGGQSTLCPN